MTKIEITKDKSGNIVKFVIDGHSEFSENDEGAGREEQSSFITQSIKKLCHFYDRAF